MVAVGAGAGAAATRGTVRPGPLAWADAVTGTAADSQAAGAAADAGAVGTVTSDPHVLHRA